MSNSRNLASRWATKEVLNTDEALEKRSLAELGRESSATLSSFECSSKILDIMSGRHARRKALPIWGYELSVKRNSALRWLLRCPFSSLVVVISRRGSLWRGDVLDSTSRGPYQEVGRVLGKVLSRRPCAEEIAPCLHLLDLHAIHCLHLPKEKEKNRIK